MQELDVRLARLEERFERLMGQQEEARTARGNLNDDLQRAEVTIATIAAQLAALTVGLGDVKASCAAINANIRWVVYLVLSIVIVAVVGSVVGAATGHVR